MKGFDFQGLCDGIDTDLFFNKETENIALDFCSECPFRKQCLTDSLEAKDIFGIFGGRTETQRRAALCLDSYNRATGKTPVCPECFSKDVHNTYLSRMSNTSVCQSCHFEWISAARMTVRLTHSID